MKTLQSRSRTDPPWRVQPPPLRTFALMTDEGREKVLVRTVLPLCVPLPPKPEQLAGHHIVDVPVHLHAPKTRNQKQAPIGAASFLAVAKALPFADVAVGAFAGVVFCCTYTWALHPPWRTDNHASSKGMSQHLHDTQKKHGQECLESEPRPSEEQSKTCTQHGKHRVRQNKME